MALELARAGSFLWSAVMTSIGPPSALSPYFALKSAIAMFTASTAFFPDRSAYTPDWSFKMPIVTPCAYAGAASNRPQAIVAADNIPDFIF